MAVPHVSGLAALTLSANPDLTPAELRQLLTGTVEASANQSDSLGKASTLLTVAFAATGITPSASTIRTAVTRRIDLVIFVWCQLGSDRELAFDQLE